MTEPADRLLDTVVELLVNGGYEGVSVRRVAKGAGVSIGAVQHHFPTKDAMLSAAMGHASHAFVEQLFSRVPPDADAVTRLRQVSLELLGMRPEQRTVSVLWVAQLARSTTDPNAAQRHAQGWQQVEDLLARMIADCLPRSGDDAVRRRSGALLAMIDGLATAALTEPDRMPPGRAQDLLSSHLDALFGMTAWT